MGIDCEHTSEPLEDVCEECCDEDWKHQYDRGHAAGLAEGRAAERAAVVGWLRDYDGSADQAARRIEDGEHETGGEGES